MLAQNLVSLQNLAKAISESLKDLKDKNVAKKATACMRALLETCGNKDLTDVLANPKVGAVLHQQLGEGEVALLAGEVDRLHVVLALRLVVPRERRVLLREPAHLRVRLPPA